MLDVQTMSYSDRIRALSVENEKGLTTARGFSPSEDKQGTPRVLELLALLRESIVFRIAGTIRVPPLFVLLLCLAIDT